MQQLLQRDKSRNPATDDDGNGFLCAGAHVAQTANALIANAVHIK